MSGGAQPSAPQAGPGPGGGALSCPTCGRAVEAGGERPASFPFCGRRCQLRDLGAWFAGRYAIPGRPSDEDGDANGDLR